MKQATVGVSEYKVIERQVQLIAKCMQMRPHQVQATLWFARKRTQNIKYSAQLSMFGDQGDVWRTRVDIDQIPPYAISKSSK